MLDTGKNPWLGIEPLRESHLETLNNFASQMEVVKKEVCLTLDRAANDIAHFYNAHHREAPLFWLNGQNIMTMHLIKKIGYKWLSPYKWTRSSHETLIGSSYLWPLAKLTLSS